MKSRNLEESTENLRNATENGAEHFCFFLEDPVPFSPSYFYWYPTQNAMYEALINDLWAMLFESPDDEGVEVFITEITEIIDDLKFKKSPFSLEMTKRIQDVWSEFDNSSSFNFLYVGSYEMLCKGTLDFEKQIRNQFRHGSEGKSIHKGQIISDHEIDEFNEFISSEIS